MKIDVRDGPGLQARGYIVDHDYEIEAADGLGAHISKRYVTPVGVEMVRSEPPPRRPSTR